jgi:hypothetical protein
VVGVGPGVGEVVGVEIGEGVSVGETEGVGSFGTYLPLFTGALTTVWAVFQVPPVIAQALLAKPIASTVATELNAKRTRGLLLLGFN